MKKSIFLFLAAILCCVNADAVKRIYIDFSAANWPTDNAKLRIWDGTNNVNMTKINDQLYYADINDDVTTSTTLYFKRLNSNGDDWDGVRWNQANCNYSSTYNAYKIGNDWNSVNASYNISTITKTNYIYFDNSKTNWNNSYKYFVIGHDAPSVYSITHSMTPITGTKMWYCKQSSDWKDATYYAFCSPTSSWTGTSWGSDNIKNADKYVKPNTSKHDLSNNNYYLCIPESGDNNSAFSISSKGTSYTKLNSTQKVYKVTSISGGTHNEASVNSGSVTISAYKMTSSNQASNANNAQTINDAATTNVSIDAAYTGETTLTATANSGYKFDGWFTAMTNGSRLSEELTYTYYPTAATTIYARFSEDVYYLSGTLVGDSPNSWTANKQPMAKNSEGDYTYTFTNHPAGEYAFKVTDGTWDKTWDWYNVVGNYYNLSEGDDKQIKLNLAETTTFTIIFNKAENKITFTGLKPATYTVAGDNRIAFGDTWNLGNTSNDMNLVGNLYTWTKTKIGLRAGTEIQFKVVKNHNWDHGSWPTDNNWVINTISQDGFYTITITFNEVTKNVKATATWTGEAPFKDFTNQPAKLYFYPTSDWKKDNAQFAAYFYNEGFGADAEPKWQDMTDPDGDDIYELDNAKEHEYVMFCRMNPSRSENNWDADVAWNKIETGLVIPNTAGELNICCTFWKNEVGNRPTSECVWVVPTPLADNNWSDFVSAYSGKRVNALIKRTFNSGQNHTLCLPFEIPTDWLGGGSKAYQLNSIFANTADELQLNASAVSTIEAGKPYIIVPIKGSEYENLIIADVKVQDIKDGSYTILGGGYKATVKSVIETDGTKTNGTTEYYIGANDGYLYNAVTSKLGLRAIIELTTASGQPLPAKVRARVVNSENAATGVDNITNTDNTTIKVIENGQLIIIRNGEKFNAQGVRF